MTVKNHTYYQNLNADVKSALRDIDYHIRQAARYKKLYELTKNKRGYKWLNRLARCRNNVHFTKGSELARENLSICMTEIEYLSNFLKEKDLT